MRGAAGAMKKGTASAPVMRRNRSGRPQGDPVVSGPRKDSQTGSASRKKGVTFSRGPPQEGVTFSRGPPQEARLPVSRPSSDWGSRTPSLTQAEQNEIDVEEPQQVTSKRVTPPTEGTTEVKEIRKEDSDSEGEPLPRRPRGGSSSTGHMSLVSGSGGEEDEDASLKLPVGRRGRGGGSNSGSSSLLTPPAGSASALQGSDGEAAAQDATGVKPRSGSSLPPPGDRENIQVVVRIRPSLPHEATELQALEVLPDGRSVIIDDGEAGEKKRAFTVDEVIDSRDSEGSQTLFFNRVGRPLLIRSLSGYNVCIFAYGHTGSGKTYTMLGDGTAYSSVPRLRAEGAGVLPRYIREVFEAHTKDPAQKKQPPRYSCEFYEVYNEQIRDLLAPPEAQGNERKRAVHAHPRHGVRIEGLSTSVISSPEDTLNLVNFGNQMRTVAATTMNERSSRSHAVFTFRWEVTADSPNRGSTVTFVDLAGREDIAEKAKDTLFKEMCYINTSLFHLAHLISKIAEGQIKSSSLSDFRNSKLTLLLSQALVGNSRTALVATVAPSRTYYEHSLSTLQFAQQVKKIETKPIVNNKRSSAVVADLEAEVQALRKELTKKDTTNTETQQALLDAQAIIADLKQSWEEAEKKSKSLDKDRRKFSVKLGLLDMANGPEWTTGGDIVPFLTKLSDDAALQGCCNYILNKPAMRIGSDEACDIILQGVGIRPEMCEADCSEGGIVTITLLFEEGEEGGGTGEEGQGEDSANIPRVLVNGQLLTPQNRTRTLEHGDCLVLGFAHAFRLAAPTRDQIRELSSDSAADVVLLARSTIGTLDLATAIAEVTEEETEGDFKEVYPYVQQLSTRVSEDTVQELLRSLRSLKPHIEEANLLTHLIFGEDMLRFEIHALTDILHIENNVPQLVVCVIYLGEWDHRDHHLSPTHHHSPLRSPGMMPLISMPFSPSSDLMSSSLIPRARSTMSQQAGLSEHMLLGGRAEPILYVWSLEKFLQRLHEMREVYTEGESMNDNFESIRKRFKWKPHTNPWREMRFKDVRLLAEAGWEASAGTPPPASACNWARPAPNGSPAGTSSAALPGFGTASQAFPACGSQPATPPSYSPLTASAPGVSPFCSGAPVVVTPRSSRGGSVPIAGESSSPPTSASLIVQPMRMQAAELPPQHATPLAATAPAAAAAVVAAIPVTAQEPVATGRVTDSTPAAAAAAAVAAAAAYCRSPGQLNPPASLGNMVARQPQQPQESEIVVLMGNSPSSSPPGAGVGRPQTLAEVARCCAPSGATSARGQLSQSALELAHGLRCADRGIIPVERDTVASTTSAWTPVPCESSTPSVEARPPDIEKLRMELLACRAETGRFTAERDRFAKLLDRLEGLLVHLSSSEKRPERRITNYRSRVHTQSHTHLGVVGSIASTDPGSSPALFARQGRRTLSPTRPLHEDLGPGTTSRRHSTFTAFPGVACSSTAALTPSVIQPPNALGGGGGGGGAASPHHSASTTSITMPRGAAGAPSSATVPSARGRRVLVRSLSNPLEPVWPSVTPPVMAASAPSVHPAVLAPGPMMFPQRSPRPVVRSPGVPGTVASTPRLVSRSSSPQPIATTPVVREPLVEAPPSNPHEMADSLFNQLDDNKDGMLTRSEFSAGMATTIFNLLDRNMDGVLSRSEFRAGMALGRSQPSVLTPLVGTGHVTPMTASTPRVASPPGRTISEGASSSIPPCAATPPLSGSTFRVSVATAASGGAPGGGAAGVAEAAVHSVPRQSVVFPQR